MALTTVILFLLWPRSVLFITLLLWLPFANGLFTQLDIKNAFLQSDLEEDIYIEQSPGFVAQGESSLVCKLHCPPYGLKQSP